MVSPSTSLVIVCCHGIWTGGPSNGFEEKEWLIADFQAGETPTFMEHIKAGLRELKADAKSILVFSGGPTRPETRLSEARSYVDLAKANRYFGILPTDPTTAGRIYAEERALDSYHNILFSLVTFWRQGGYKAWPSRLTIVSHAFKKSRIVDGHCAAIGFPLERAKFVGIDPPAMASTSKENPSEGSAMFGVVLATDQWTADPHGVGEELAGKRRRRNPWGISQALFLADEERSLSGVTTRILGDGSEVLTKGKEWPWAR